ncbi:hypothetical protein [Streptomyces sp. NPDC055085]
MPKTLTAKHRSTVSKILTDLTHSGWPPFEWACVVVDRRRKTLWSVSIWKILRRAADLAG